VIDKRLTCALRVGDEVEILLGRCAGEKATVKRVSHPAAMDWILTVEGTSGWRDAFKLIRRVETIEAERNGRRVEPGNHQNADPAANTGSNTVDAQPKFKVGDRVRVLAGCLARGATGRITEIDPAGFCPIQVLFDKPANCWKSLNFSPTILELLPSSPKPCPNCGGEARESSESETKWWCVCHGDCGMEGPTADTREGSIDLWDRIEMRQA
jgi:ribosomal protein L24